MKFYKIIIALLLAANSYAVFAQDAPQGQSKYDQHKVFTPLFYPDKGNEYRTASGAPGVKYWQKPC